MFFFEIYLYINIYTKAKRYILSNINFILIYFYLHLKYFNIPLRKYLTIIL